ncbi:hypothetical protein [Antarcticibacterium sp. 1MA-6-2]|nr:hypothetical protein [Antarcticibacterium sp. 1MA-6-2]
MKTLIKPTFEKVELLAVHFHTVDMILLTKIRVIPFGITIPKLNWCT